MFLFIFIIIFNLFSHYSQASGEFSVVQNISYTFSAAGDASVNQEINLTNNISQIYAKEYQINLTVPNIQNVKGHDKYGDIIASLKNDDSATTAFLKFSNPTIGKGQTNQFFLDYFIPNFAQKKGNTWEIQFPLFDNNQDTQKINLSLDVPSQFGDLSFSSIPISNIHTINDHTQIQFSQNQSNSKILLIFGDHQLFDFKLNYHLQNQETVATRAEIPLPPDTNNQTITFKNFDPQPQKIVTDSDGNWLAQYILTPSQSLDVTVMGQAKVHPSAPEETAADIPSLTQAQKYWPVDDPQIQSLSQNYLTPKQIYQYVVRTLNYNYSGIDTASRQGALSAIANPNNALCTEFTDLFVTLARANHIPAREIEGFAYSNNSKIKPTNINSDILHAWPEYYDSGKKTWIQVDPTWEKTTNGIDYFSDIDLNHLAFVIHGKSSVSPPPPGSYKKDNLTKSVYVDFATDYIDTKFTPPILTISANKLNIYNPNFYSLSNFIIRSNQLNWSEEIDKLTPLSSLQIDLPSISFINSILPHFQKINFTISGLNTPVTIDVNYQQHFLNLAISLGIVIFILCLGGIILTATQKTNEKNT